MVRKLFGVLAMAVMLCVGAVMADELTGRLKSVDTKAKEIKVTGDDNKEVTIKYTDKTDIVKGGGGRGGKGGKGGKGGTPTTISIDDLKTLLDNAGDKAVNVTVTHEKNTASKIQVKGGRRGGGGGQ
jgi:hypothetical protein